MLPDADRGFNSIPVVRGSDAPEPDRCGAKLRKTNPARYCMQRPIAGRERCRLHGGKSPRGVLSPHYQGKGFSKDIPTRYMDRMRESAEDPELTSMRGSLALVDARIDELLGRVSDTDLIAVLQQLRTEHATLHALTGNFDQEDIQTKLIRVCDRIGSLLRSTTSDVETWEQIDKFLQSRRKIAETERKREESMSGTMTASQATVFVASIMEAVNKHTSDASTKMAIAAEITKLLNRKK
jgi:hypothetical protein